MYHASFRVPYAHWRLLGKHIWPVNMCARDSGIDYGCQISGLKALPACATPPAPRLPLPQWGRKAAASVLCIGTQHPLTFSPSPRTHTHTHATRGNPLPAIAWNPSRFINSHYCCHCCPHWIANVCVCVCVAEGEGAVRTRRNNNDATAKNEMLQRSASFLLRVLKRIAYLCV